MPSEAGAGGRPYPPHAHRPGMRQHMLQHKCNASNQPSFSWRRPRNAARSREAGAAGAPAGWPWRRALAEPGVPGGSENRRGRVPSDEGKHGRRRNAGEASVATILAIWTNFPPGFSATVGTGKHEGAPKHTRTHAHTRVHTHACAHTRNPEQT